MAMAALWTVFACGPKPKPEIKPSVIIPVPYDLAADVTSHKATLRWAINRQPDKPISGYNIYLSEKSLKDNFKNWVSNHPEPYNHAPYPGDTDGNIKSESFPLDNLISGKTYFASIRTLGVDGVESAPSNEIRFMPLAKGEFKLSSIHEAENGGFCFDTENSVPARDPQCDIYLYAANGRIGISSPHRLGAGLRKTGFQPADSKEKYDETIVIILGDRVNIKTKFGHASLKIEYIRKQGDDVLATISYIFYQNQ